jgi:hypothetical protein
MKLEEGSVMDKERTERGSALIGVVLVTLILSMLGTVSLNLAIHEIQQASVAGDEAVAQHLAEAGSDLVMQWFHDPSSHSGGTTGSLVTKRYDLPDSGPSFFDSTGKSQFSGTSMTPDLLYDASNLADDRLLNDPTTGWFRSLGALGRILKLKVYGPRRPDLLCTVEVTAAAKELTRTVSVQLGTLTIPPLRAGIQIGNSAGTVAPEILPVWVHWGDMKIKGDVHFGRREEFPAKTVLAPVTGQSYSEASLREDRWLDVFVGGDTFFTPSSIPAPAPSNLYAHQDPAPGLHEDHWDYETLKRYARLYGSY